MNINSPSVIHGGKSVAQDIQEHLLQLSAVALNDGQILRDNKVDGNMAVVRLLALETQYLLKKRAQRDTLGSRLRPLGEAEQPMGDGAASLHGPEHDLGDLQEPIPFGRFRRHGDQIFQQAGVFTDDGQRVVNLVGNSGGHPADGGHLICVFNTMKRLVSPVIRLPDAVQQGCGTPEHHGRDQDNTDAKQPEDIAPKPQPALHDVSRMLQDNEDERRLLDIGIPEDPRLSFLVGYFQNLRLRRDGRRRNRAWIENSALVPRRGLQDALAVDQEGIAGYSEVEGRNMPAQHFRIYGSPENVEASLFGGISPDGDHEVGEVAVTREDVAYVNPSNADFVEPILFLVVFPFQLVGSHVGALIAIRVNDAQVDESAKRLIPNFIVNAAAIAISLPVALVIAPYLGVAPEVVFFSSLAAAGMPFLLLTGSAPNAIAYESKQFSAGTFFLAGVPASILLMAVLSLFVCLIWPLMGMRLKEVF